MVLGNLACFRVCSLLPSRLLDSPAPLCSPLNSSSSVAYSLYSDGKPAEDVVERMRRADNQRESRVEELRHVREQYSPSTGAPLWKPKVRDTQG